MSLTWFRVSATSDVMSLNLTWGCSQRSHNMTKSSLLILASINYHLKVNIILNINWPFQIVVLLFFTRTTEDLSGHLTFSSQFSCIFHDLKIGQLFSRTRGNPAFEMQGQKCNRIRLLHKIGTKRNPHKQMKDSCLSGRWPALSRCKIQDRHTKCPPNMKAFYLHPLHTVQQTCDRENCWSSHKPVGIHYLGLRLPHMRYRNNPLRSTVMRILWWGYCLKLGWRAARSRHVCHWPQVWG